MVYRSRGIFLVRVLTYLKGIVILSHMHSKTLSAKLLHYSAMNKVGKSWASGQINNENMSYSIVEDIFFYKLPAWQLPFKLFLP